VAADKYGILGEKAPELNLDTWIDGDGLKKKTLRLKDLRGKVIYMYFFQDWCPGCHSHGFPTLKALSQKFKSNPDVFFIAVQTTFEGFSINTQDKLIANQKKYDINIPMAHDAGNRKNRALPKTMIRYRSGGTPWTVIIDPEGIVVYNQFHITQKKAVATIQELIKEHKG